jgi:hypothetical protein
MLFIHALVALFSLMMLGRHGPRALLFLSPRSIKITGDPDAPARTSAQLAAGELLESLGFRRLGVRSEQSPLGGLRMAVDAWAHDDGTCADAFPAVGRGPVVSFLTTFADGYQLGTSNFRRIAAESAAGRVGGLAGTALHGALAAHRKAAEPLAEPHGRPPPVADLDARIALAQRFYAGVGAVELRKPAFMSLLNTALALLLIATSVRQALRGLGILP